MQETYVWKGSYFFYKTKKGEKVKNQKTKKVENSKKQKACILVLNSHCIHITLCLHLIPDFEEIIFHKRHKMLRW